VTSIALTRTFAARPEQVWTAFTDPDALTAWFWPARLRTTVSADVRVGGAFRIESVIGEMAISGQYREVAAPHRLVMTWRWDGEDTESLVTIELTPTDGGTELRLRHQQLADDQQRDQHEQGWNDCLDRLVSHFR
jgi:uncharacterized protein YndB with AHSA1/START domain